MRRAEIGLAGQRLARGRDRFFASSLQPVTLAQQLQAARVLRPALGEIAKDLLGLRPALRRLVSQTQVELRHPLIVHGGTPSREGSITGRQSNPRPSSSI